MFFRFLDEYHPDIVPNYSDDEARYTFDRQPEVAKENLQYLADALKPVMDKPDSLDSVLVRFDGHYRDEYVQLMRRKFGIDRIPKNEAEDLHIVRVGLINI